MIALIGVSLGLILIGYVLSGYSPSRRLEPVLGNRYIIGIGKLGLWEIDGSSLKKWYNSYIPLPPGFKVISIYLKWSEWVSNDKEHEVIKGTTEKKYKTANRFEGDTKGFLGSREEWVPALKNFEAVHYAIPVKSEGGFDFTFLFFIIYKVNSGLKAVTHVNFKLRGQILLETQIIPWAAGRSVEALRLTNVDVITDQNIGIIVPGGKDIVSDINDEKLRKIGIEISEIGLRVLDGKNTQEYFAILQKRENLKQQNLNTQQETVNAEEEGKLREKIREIEKADADQETLIMTERIDGIITSMQPATREIWAGKAYVESQRPYVLAEVKHESDKTGEKIMETIGNVVDKIQSQQHSQKTQKVEVGSE